MPFTVSPAGRAAIRQREGFSLVAYRDSKGIPTIGVGHVDATLPVTTMGMRITSAQVDTLLAADLAIFEQAIAKAVRVALTQAQGDALASLAFNIGAKGFSGSTVVKRLNAGDYQGAADAFLMWEKPAVLKARREAERAQFLAGAHDIGQIATAPSQPALNAIIGKVNQAAYGPAVLQPAMPSAKPSWWARFVAALQGKSVA